MFKIAKKLRSSLIRNSSKSFVVSPLIRKCAVRAICIGNLSNDVDVFFLSCITTTVEQKKAKARRKKYYSGSSEEDGEEFNNNNCGISFWTVFNWSGYSISSFPEHISRELLTTEFDLISCKTMRSRRKLKILY